RAAKGLEIGLCDGVGCGACARAPNAWLGTAGLATGAEDGGAPPRVCETGGRGGGSGMVRAKGGAVKQAKSTAKPSFVRALSCAAIRFSASCPYGISISL